MERVCENSHLASAWNDYRQRRRWFFAVWLGGMVVVFLLSWPLTALLDSDVPFYIIGGLWMLAFGIAGVRLTLFTCPRCRQWFFCTWWSSNHFARHCVHCGLPKWKEINSDEQG